MTGRASRFRGRGSAMKDAWGNRNPLTKPPRGQKQVSGALLAGKRRYKGYLLFLQITTVHTEVGKGHQKLNLNLVPSWLAEITPGLSSSQECVVHPLKCPPNHGPSPFSFFITFIHEEFKFKEQNRGGKAPPRHLLKLILCSYCLQ